MASKGFPYWTTTEFDFCPKCYAPLDLKIGLNFAGEQTIIAEQCPNCGWIPKWVRLKDIDDELQNKISK